MNKKIISILILLMAMSTMVYAGSQLIAAEQVYHEGNAAYESLSGRVKTHAPTDPAAAGDEVATAMGISYDILQTISEDAVAWLYSPDTVIDYPIMKAEDYDFYLHHLPDGTENAHGSLFIDFNCAPDFSDPLTIIYGHHMKSGSMFGSLKGYKEQGYYDQHPNMYLYTPTGDYRIDLLYGCVIDAGQWRERAFMYKENIEALIAYAAYNTSFQSGAVYNEGDRIVAMSTCSYEFEDARYVVIGILNENPLETEVR